MRQVMFTWISHVTYRKYGTIITLCTIITFIFGYFAGQIRIETNWRALIPADNPSTKNFETILENFGAATQIVVAIEGQDRENVISAALELAPLLQEATAEFPPDATHDNSYETQVVRRIDYHLDTQFIASHGFMLEKASNLEKSEKLFTDYNFVPFIRHTNDILEDSYVQDTENLTQQEKRAVRQLDGLYRFTDMLYEYALENFEQTTSVDDAVRAVTIGDEFYLSIDKKMLLMFLTPTFTVDEIDASVVGVNKLDEVFSEFSDRNSDIRTSMTGMHVVVRDEMEAGLEDTYRNVLFALTFILLVFMISFRMITGSVLAMIVLVFGITWDVGLAYLFIGRLNIFTAVCSVILLGLGVDYAIHVISAYSEYRHKGKSIEHAIHETFSKIGPGLVTGSVTTAIAFLSLVFTSYAAFREFGFVVGAGILCCLLVSLFLLPALLVAKDKLTARFRKMYRPNQVDLEFKLLGSITDTTQSHPFIVMAGIIVISIILSLFIPQVSMMQNYMDLEPEGLESIRLQKEIPKRFNMSPDNMLALVNSLKEADRLTETLRERRVVGLTESIADYVPTPEKQEERIPVISRILNAQKNLPKSTPIDRDALIEELYRFNDNITELSSLAFISGLDMVFDKTNYYLELNEEGDQIGDNRIIELIGAINNDRDAIERLAAIQPAFISGMTRSVSTMANTNRIQLETAPEHIRERFVSDDGTKFLVIIYAKQDIWDGLYTGPLLYSVIRDVPGATGSPVFMKEMVETAKEEGIFALTLACISIFIILLIDFRRVSIALTALFPLVLALLWMIGIMGLIGFPFSVVNVIGLPLVLGIGIDDGVHVIHRYRAEGQEKLSYTVSSIGKAITLTTVTTLLGFGSLIPSIYRGYASLGILICLGIGLCYLTSVFILPPLLHRFMKTD